MSKFSRSNGSGLAADPEFLRALEEGDPRRGRHRRAGHKDRQLCRQVERALLLVLDGDLSDLVIADVTPLAGCARLLVQVVIPDGADPLQTLERLRLRTGALRAQVAHCISRKRVPELSFVLVTQDLNHD